MDTLNHRISPLRYLPTFCNYWKIDREASHHYIYWTSGKLVEQSQLTTLQSDFSLKMWQTQNILGTDLRIFEYPRFITEIKTTTYSFNKSLYSQTSSIQTQKGVRAQCLHNRLRYEQYILKVGITGTKKILAIECRYRGVYKEIRIAVQCNVWLNTHSHFFIKI